MKRFNKSIAIVMITRSGTLWNGSCSIMHGYSHDLFGSIKLVFIYDYIGNLVIEMEAGNYFLIINLQFNKDSIKVKESIFAQLQIVLQTILMCHFHLSHKK